MAIETVRVAFVDTAVVPVLVDGVAVRAFDMLGNLITTGIAGDTGTPGLCELELPGDTTPVDYTLRFFLTATSIRPVRVSIYSPASDSPSGTNSFSVRVSRFVLPPAVNPKMCRCSGYILNPDGTPRTGMDLTFIPRYAAFVDDTAAVMPGRFLARTDRSGYVCVDLFRYGIYDVILESREVVARVVEIPDAPSVLMAHLLFPVLVSVRYAEAPPFTVSVGQELVLTPTLRSSDGRDLGLGIADCQYSVADTSVASVSLLSDRIVVRGIAGGTTTLRVTRLDSSILYLPDLGIDGGEVSVVVT